MYSINEMLKLILFFIFKNSNVEIKIPLGVVVFFSPQSEELGPTSGMLDRKTISTLIDPGLTEFIQIIVGILFDLLTETKPESD